MRARGRSIRFALALALTLAAGCAGLFRPPPAPSAQGPNPLTSGGALLVTHVPMSYPAYHCKPRREPVEYKLVASAAEVCVDFKGGVMREVGQGAPATGPMQVVLHVDGASSQSFALETQGLPSPLNDCTSPRDPPYREWVVQARGCTQNGGLLTAQSRAADLASAQDGATYARFQFGDATP
jgi:hypothetical protein